MNFSRRAYWDAICVLEAERDALAARLAAAEAVAEEWEERWRDNPAPTNADAGRYGAAMRLRNALATGTTNPQEADQ